MCWYPNVPKYFFLFHKIMKNRRCRLNIRKTTHVVKRLFYVFFFLFSSSSFFSLFLLRLLLYRYDNFTKTINLVTLTIKKEEKKNRNTFRARKCPTIERRRTKSVVSGKLLIKVEKTISATFQRALYNYTVRRLYVYVYIYIYEYLHLTRQLGEKCA